MYRTKLWLLHKEFTGALFCFGEEIQALNSNIYNIDEVIIQIRNIYLFHNFIKKLLSEENKVPGTLFEARNVAGSATYKQIVLSFKVGLFMSHENEN